MTATNDGEREARRVADTASKEARKLGDTARDEAAKLADTARHVGRDQAEKQLDRTKQVAEDQIGTVEAALDGAAERLREEDSPLASYASDLSSQLSGLSSRIESASVDDLARDGRRLARENPAMFMLGAVAVGFVASRFLKASEQADHDYPSDRFGGGRDRDGGYDGGYGDSYGGSYGGGRRDRYDPYGRDGGYRDDPYRASGTAYDAPYRSPVADPTGPRDRVDPTPRAPMDSGATADPAATTGAATTTGAAPTGTAAADPVQPRVNLPVNDRGADAGTSSKNTNEGAK